MARAFIGASNEYLNTAFSVFTDEPFTLSLWFRTTEVTAEQNIFSIADVDDTAHHSLTKFGDDLRATSWNGASGSYATYADSISVNTWHHGLAVFAADDDRRIYLDGDRGTDNTGTETIGSFDNIKIGVSADSTPFGYFDGRIAEAAIWNVVLTDAEAVVLATGLSPLAVRPGSLVFHPRLVRDEDEDIVGGLSLSANGTPTIEAHPRVIYPAPPMFHMKTGAAPADINIDIGLDEAAYQGTGVRIVP